MAYIPDRGHIVRLDFNPRAGHEQMYRRSVLVISPGAYNEKVGLIIVCPITRQIKGYPFEVQIPFGLDVTGVILSDQVESLDWRVRNAELICELPGEVVQQVLQKLGVLLDYQQGRVP